MCVSAPRWFFSVRLGGNLNNGTNAGVLYFNANNSVSNANWSYGGGLLPLCQSIHTAHCAGCSLYTIVWIIPTSKVTGT